MKEERGEEGKRGKRGRGEEGKRGRGEEGKRGRRMSSGGKRTTRFRPPKRHLTLKGYTHINIHINRYM